MSSLALHVANLARSPLGRARIRFGLKAQSWPLVNLLAHLHRRLIAGSTTRIAVVGSMGKTTATQAIRLALDLEGFAQVKPNFGGFLGLEMLRVKPSQPTAVFEVGISGPGQMRRYAKLIRPSVVVFTGVGSDHRRSLGTVEETIREKSEMLRVLDPSGVVVVNGDDPLALRAAESSPARIVTFGFGPENVVRAGEVVLDWPRGSRFSVTVGDSTWDVETGLIGRHMAYPALAACAVGRELGLDLDAVVDRLRALRPVPGRMQPVPIPGGGYLLRDDYKSTVESTEAALETLASIPARRRIVVLGGLTDQPKKHRPAQRRIGKMVGEIADHLVIMGNTKRHFAAGAGTGGLEGSAVATFGRDLQGALDYLRSMIQEGDVVLVKGRRTLRIDRLSIGLAGADIGCRIPECDANSMPCDICPMLGRGWT